MDDPEQNDAGARPSSGSVVRNKEEGHQDKLLQQFESVTIHGLPNILSAKTWVARTVWSAFCICALVFLVMTTAWTFTEFFKYEIVSVVHEKSRNKMNFPGVTFCSTSIYDLVSHTNETASLQHLPKNCRFTDRKYFANDLDKEIFYYACRMFIASLDVNTSAFGGVRPRYFRFPQQFAFAPHFHLCFTLNRNSTQSQQVVGERHGLRMILYSENEKREATVFENKMPLEEEDRGIYVYIHDPRVHVPFSRGIVISEGFHTHISIQKQVIKRKPSPYPSQCIHASQQYGIYPGINTEQHCLRSWFYDGLYKKCSGTMVDMRNIMKAPEYPQKANMSDPTFSQCYTAFLSSIDISKSPCKPLCDEEQYEVKVSRNPWPHHSDKSSLSHIVLAMSQANSTNPDDVTKHLMKLSVFYGTMSEAVYEEKPMYEFATLVSTLGGQMGLFFGASLLSIVELFYLGFKCLKQYLVKRKATSRAFPEV